MSADVRNSIQPWYAAKCVFKHNDLPVEQENAAIYEERIILVRADDEDSAICQAEREAAEYARSLGNVEYLNYIMVFHLFNDDVGHLTEVFSEMRESVEDEDSYIDKYYDTGNERARSQ